MDEAENLADRILILAAGRIVTEGTPATIGGRQTDASVITFTMPDGLSVFVRDPRARGFTLALPVLLLVIFGAIFKSQKFTESGYTIQRRRLLRAADDRARPAPRCPTWSSAWWPSGSPGRSSGAGPRRS